MPVQVYTYLLLRLEICRYARAIMGSPRPYVIVGDHNDDLTPHAAANMSEGTTIGGSRRSGPRSSVRFTSTWTVFPTLYTYYRLSELVYTSSIVSIQRLTTSVPDIYVLIKDENPPLRGRRVPMKVLVLWFSRTGTSCILLILYGYVTSALIIITYSCRWLWNSWAIARVTICEQL